MNWRNLLHTSQFQIVSTVTHAIDSNPEISFSTLRNSLYLHFLTRLIWRNSAVITIDGDPDVWFCTWFDKIRHFHSFPHNWFDEILPSSRSTATQTSRFALDLTKFIFYSFSHDWLRRRRPSHLLLLQFIWRKLAYKTPYFACCNFHQLKNLTIFGSVALFTFWNDRSALRTNP